MIILIILVFALSTILFKKAAGTLNIGKLNIISYVYYIFMLQSFIGASLIVLGWNKHYTLSYLLDREKGSSITAVAIWLIAIFLPLLILLFQKMFRLDIKKEYAIYLNKKITVGKEDLFFDCFTIISVVCIFLLIGFLFNIGYIPILKLFFSPSNFNFALERARINDSYFIHPYISNILVLMLIPMLSYISFSYFVAMRTKRWAILSIVLFIASVIVKTYKFEKSPLVFYFVAFILIYIYFRGGIKFVYMAAMAFVLGGIIVVFYFLQGFTGTIFDIYNGPMGRTLFTEVGTLAYCFDLFPNVFGFLNGRSFTPTILKLLGRDSSEYLRSSQLTMAFYGSEKVYDGSAGVMNTLFAGEAYANWGWRGVVFSVIWVAFILALLMYIILRLKKTPTMVSVLAMLTTKIGLMLEGGFCDFIYSFDIIFTLILVFSIYICFEKNGKIANLIDSQQRKLKGRIQKWFRF